MFISSLGICVIINKFTVRKHSKLLTNMPEIRYKFKWYIINGVEFEMFRLRLIGIQFHRDWIKIGLKAALKLHV